MNIKNLFKFVLVWVALAGVVPAMAAFKDVKIDLNSLLTSEEMAQGAAVSYGIVVADDGTLTRVAADDATANAVVSGTYHSEHGWTGSKMVIAVEGTVKVGIGNCTFGNHNAKIVAADGTTVNIATVATCYKNDQSVSYGYYTGSATTLTISGADYNRYFSVEKAVVDYMVTYYNEAYTTADATYTEFIRTPYATGETIGLPATTPIAPSAKKFSHWATADGTEVKAGAAAANLSVYPVWVDAAVMIGATEKVIKPGDLYGITGCVTKGDNQLIDSSKEGSYVLFDVMPEVSGSYSFTSMIGTTNDNMGVTVGYIDANGEFVASEKKVIENSGNWNNGSNYTWTYDLYEGNIYTFKILCHSDQTYCVNVFEMTVKKEADLTPQGYKDFAIDLTGQWLLTAAEYADKSNVEFGVVVGENGAMSRVPADSELATFVISGKYHNDHGWAPVTVKVPVNGSVKVGFGQCTYGGATATITDADGNVQEVAVDKTGCYSRTKSEDQITYATYSGKSTTLTIKNTTYSPYISVTAIEDVKPETPVEIPAKSVEIGTVEAVIGEGDLVDINNCKQKAGQLIDSSYDGSYVTFIVNTTKAGEYMFTSMIGTTVDGAAITLGYVDENGEYIASEKQDITNSGNWNDGPNYTWKFNLEANKVYTFKILCHTASGSGYCVNLFAMNIGMEGLITPEYTVTYGLGDVAAEGVVPTAVKVKAGQSVTIPANFTLYAEGKTLTGWTDGTNTYAIGQEFTVTSEMALTPVFTDNKVSLDDRTKEVTVKWTFRRDEGAPTVAWEGQSGLIWVAQAVVEGQTIDVKMDVSTSPGKMANGNWTDWCQLNGGTKITIPSCKGAVVSIEAYSAPTTTTIDGQTDYTANGNTISYTVANTANTIDIVIGDGSYYRYIQAVLPFVEKSYAGTVFENAEASAIWAFTSNATDPAVTSPKGAFTMNSVSTGSFTLGTGNAKDVDYVTVMPADATDPVVSWSIKPAKGLTFTPTKVSAKVQRFGTDGGNLDVIGRTGDGQEVTLATGLIPVRNNKTLADDKFAGDSKLVEEFVLDVPAELASTEGFTLVVKVSNLGNTKTIGFSDVQIHGIINGTVADVAKYALTATGNIAEAGKVTVYPVSDKYDEGTELTLTAAEDFGYDFVNWTNAAGEEISTEAKFVYTVNADEALTANFVKVNTYELAMTIEGGANDYMVSYNPVPTIVDGKQMYEEGTVVGIAAASNPILTFTNWSNGESNPSLSVTMDGDKAYTAVYSAADYIVGWDFIKKGGNGRPADFASTVDNETATLYMTNANGDTQGWLDKSKEAAGGYESFEGAAVNWKKLGEYWYEFKINASEFTNIRVEAEMMYNYNAYTTVIVEYSTDGAAWTEAGRVTMAGAKTENPVSATLGEDANNASSLLVRFRPDLDGAVDGSSAPDNDGTTISNIYVYGDMKLVDDGQDPTLLSSIPADGATGASATGKIVLNFHEKVALQNAKATIGDKEVEGAVSGKTVTFSYMGLEYNTEYTFTLAANSVYDLTGNACKNDIVIKFTTIAPPTVVPGQYDAVVTNVDEFLAALKKADGSNRFRIFLHDGIYDLGTACLTNVPGNVSLIGESMENTIIMNDPQAEGIGVSATLCTGGENIYMQDLTLKSTDYDRLLNTGSSIGRCVVLQENASKAVYKNVRLLSNQDTYYTRATKRTYWEGGLIAGTVDYLCGGGDVFFNGVTLYNNKRGSGDCITAPATSSDWGYVFSNCTIDGAAEQDGAYSLGRPWQSSPRAVYINTTMKIIPAASGWSDMGAVPALFAEYNSHTESGAPVDCSNRKTSFKSNDVNVAVSYNPVLTAEEAAKFTVENVLAGEDGWQPQLLTEQANTPKVTVESGILTWNASDYVFCYAICKNGKVVTFTNENSWTIPADATDEDFFSVRAANNMGGLGAASEALSKNGAEGFVGIVAEGEVLSTEIFNLNGVQLNTLQQGVNIIRKTYANGAVTVEKNVVK